MPFHAPFALVPIKSGQDLSQGIRLTTFCFAGKVLTALRFPSLRSHTLIYNMEFRSEYSTVLVKPARADIVIWEELIYSCKIFMGTKKEAFASPSSGSNPCFEVTTTGSRFEPSTSKMLPNLQTFLLCVQILISTSVSKEEFLMRRETYKTLLHSGVSYVYRSVFECKVTGFPDTLQASSHPFSVILT